MPLFFISPLHSAMRDDISQLRQLPAGAFGCANDCLLPLWYPAPPPPLYLRYSHITKGMYSIYTRKKRVSHVAFFFVVVSLSARDILGPSCLSSSLSLFPSRLSRMCCWDLIVAWAEKGDGAKFMGCMVLLQYGPRCNFTYHPQYPNLSFFLSTRAFFCCWCCFATFLLLAALLSCNVR